MGVHARKELFARGVTRRQLEKHLKSRRWRVIFRGVYLTEARAPTHAEKLQALQKRFPTAVFSHATAAILHGLEGDFVRLFIEITVPLARVKVQRGSWVHRASFHQVGDVTTVGGLRCTTLERTLLDLATFLDDRNLAVAFESAWRRMGMGWVDRLFWDHVRGAQGHRGARRLKRLILDAWRRKRPKRSALEVDYLLFHRARRLPRMEHEYQLEDSKGRMFIDTAFPERGLALETDGASAHWNRMAEDAARRLRILAQGLSPGVITHDRIHLDPYQLERDLRAVFQAFPRRRRRRVFEEPVVILGPRPGSPGFVPALHAPSEVDFRRARWRARPAGLSITRARRPA